MTAIHTLNIKLSSGISHHAMAYWRVSECHFETDLWPRVSFKVTEGTKRHQRTFCVTFRFILNKARTVIKNILFINSLGIFFYVGHQIQLMDGKGKNLSGIGPCRIQFRSSLFQRSAGVKIWSSYNSWTRVHIISSDSISWIFSLAGNTASPLTTFSSSKMLRLCLKMDHRNVMTKS